MTIDIIIGTQWGDEGKGRIVDLLAAQADLVARYNGGDNAGHTVTVGSQTFKLHLLPSGIIHPHTLCILGSGMVINPETFLKEIEMLRAAGIDVQPGRLKVAYNAHLITPAHRALDAAQEKALGKGQIGTTGRGIGPAYTDRAARRGLRVEDVLDEAAFRRKMEDHLQQANRTLQALYAAEPLDVAATSEAYLGWARQLQPYVAEISLIVAAALRAGKRLLAEGAQGVLLDIDHGTYPFVTSSSPTSAGVLPSLGVGVGQVNRVLGVTKAFQTRVGAGPFPTEVSGDLAVRLRGTGSNPWDEFGTTTGRPRRVGWLDGVLLRYAARINGLTELAVTKLDILSGLETLQICTAYRSGGQEYSELPLGPGNLAVFTPVYQELPGWQEDITSARQPGDLPAAARAYLDAISTACAVPIRLVSVGPERDQVITM